MFVWPRFSSDLFWPFFHLFFRYISLVCSVFLGLFLCFFLLLGNFLFCFFYLVLCLILYSSLWSLFFLFPILCVWKFECLPPYLSCLFNSLFLAILYISLSLLDNILVDCLTSNIFFFNYKSRYIGIHNLREYLIPNCFF